MPAARDRTAWHIKKHQGGQATRNIAAFAVSLEQRPMAAAGLLD